AVNVMLGALDLLDRLLADIHFVNTRVTDIDQGLVGGQLHQDMFRIIGKHIDDPIALGRRNLVFLQEGFLEWCADITALGIHNQQAGLTGFKYCPTEPEPCITTGWINHTDQQRTIIFPLYPVNIVFAIVRKQDEIFISGSQVNHLHSHPRLTLGINTNDRRQFFSIRRQAEQAYVGQVGKMFQRQGLSKEVYTEEQAEEQHDPFHKLSFNFYYGW